VITCIPRPLSPHGNKTVSLQTALAASPDAARIRDGLDQRSYNLAPGGAIIRDRLAKLKSHQKEATSMKLELS
jgi:hypothetical protein